MLNNLFRNYVLEMCSKLTKKKVSFAKFPIQSAPPRSHIITDWVELTSCFCKGMPLILGVFKSNFSLWYWKLLWSWHEISFQLSATSISLSYCSTPMQVYVQSTIRVLCFPPDRRGKHGHWWNDFCSLHFEGIVEYGRVSILKMNVSQTEIWDYGKGSVIIHPWLSLLTCGDYST